MKQSKKKLEDYELDNHVRTLTEAHDISCCPETMKQVQKHAKKKKKALHNISKLSSHSKEEALESPAEHALESEDDEKKEIKSIDQIRNRRKKLKAKMFKVE